MKNEAPFLLEWVAYHRAIGFDRIIVAYNDCSDGTDELLLALQDIGAIAAIENEVSQSDAPQAAAAKLIMSTGEVRQGDWVLWLDADEFLNIHLGEGLVDDLFQFMGDADGILLNWRIFGDGHGEFGGRMLGEPFVLAASPDRELCRSVKSLCRMDGHIERLDIHRPVLNPDANTNDMIFLNGRGERIDADCRSNQRWFAGKGSRVTSRVGRSDFGWDIAQINHYAVRDRHFFQKKLDRGRGYKAARKGNSRHGEEYWTEHNLNDQEDHSILRMGTRTDREIDLLLRDPKVRELHDRVYRQRPSPDHDILENFSDLMEYDKPLRPSEAEPFVLTLPVAEAECLRSSFRKGARVLEYGSGGSTFEALRNDVSMVFSVESDGQWAKRIIESLSHEFSRDRFEVVHADIGATKAWGKPANNRAYRNYHLYASAVWDLPDFRQPDLILIDGRFRASCFATAAMRITQPTLVLFDDYVGRAYYHWVEEICPPTKLVGRMAVFDLKPGMVPTNLLTRVAGSYVDSR